MTITLVRAVSSVSNKRALLYKTRRVIFPAGAHSEFVVVLTAEVSVCARCREKATEAQSQPDALLAEHFSISSVQKRGQREMRDVVKNPNSP